MKGDPLQGGPAGEGGKVAESSRQGASGVVWGSLGVAALVLKADGNPIVVKVPEALAE